MKMKHKSSQQSQKLICMILTVYLLFMYVTEASTTISPNAAESRMNFFSKCAVCIDAAPCSDIGKFILKKNGSAVDAAIASFICNGLVNMESMSIGGGFIMLIYNKNENKVYAVNAKEMAPKKAKNEYYKKENATTNGPLAVAVPGVMRGFSAIHSKFGALPWNQVVEPSIDLCRQGYKLTHHLIKSIKERDVDLKKDENFRDWLFDSNGEMKKAGTIISPMKLCNTLAVLAKNGPDDFYTGETSKLLLQDLAEMGSLISEEDLKDYYIEWLDPIKLNLPNGHTFYSSPPPGSGAVLGFILNTLAGYNFTKESIKGTKNTVTTYHRIVETFKYAYAKRTELADPKFVDVENVLRDLLSNEYAASIRSKIKDDETHSDPKYYGGKYYFTDHGTSHLSVIAPNGDVVASTCSVNLLFGSGVTSKQTGIVLNDHMDDFSFPWKINFYGYSGSPKNKMEPRKRPLSSMSPTIIFDSNNKLKLTVGGAGGSQIITSVALTIIRILWFDKSVKEAVDMPRIHHQLLPMQINYEEGISDPVIVGLKSIGHTMKLEMDSIVCALLRENQYIYGKSDYRKLGGVSGFD